jgi:hypothetical protein
VAVDGSSRAAAAAAVAAMGAGAGAGTGSTTMETAAPPLLLAAVDLAAGAAAGGGVGHAAGVSRAMRLEAGASELGGPPSGSTWGRNGLPPALSQESIGANYVLAR